MRLILPRSWLISCLSGRISCRVGRRHVFSGNYAGQAVRVTRTVLVAISWLAVALAAGCETNHTRTAGAADKLEQRIEAFAAGACYQSGAACFSPEQLAAVRWFADQVQEFRETCVYGGDQDVVFAFRHLWRTYHTLRDEVYRPRDRQLQVDFKPVTQAFVDVQRDVKNGYSYADPSLYASGGYVFDPYYN
jgi:hypothetical protein